MTWLTPGEFKTAVEIERKCGGAGFAGLLAAAIAANTKYKTSVILNELWPNVLNPVDWEAGRQIVDEYIIRNRFEVFLAAAALHADLKNQRKIELGWPGLNEELNIRYNTPGGLIPGEQLKMDGKLYKCVEVVDDYGDVAGRKVVEAEGE